MECRTCRSRFEKFTTRKSFVPVKKRSAKHIHYGTPYFRYGICHRNHYTKLKRDRIEWSYCHICKNVKNTLEKKRRYLEAKKRKAKKQVPSFLKAEFEKFKKEDQKRDEEYREIYEDPFVVKEVIREELRTEVRNEVMEEVRAEIREELKDEIKDSVRDDIIKEIRKSLKIRIYKEMKHVMKQQVQNTLDMFMAPAFRRGHRRSLSQPPSPAKPKISKVRFECNTEPNSPDSPELSDSMIPSPPSPPPTPSMSDY